MEFKQFIKANDKYSTTAEPVNAPYIRKAFTLDFKPEKAVIDICTGGFYELYINGKNITKGFLAPYIVNPDMFLCYDEYDVAELLDVGENVIGIVLGNGFMNQDLDNWKLKNAPYDGPLSVAVEFTAEKGDENFKMSSDESFKTYPSPITFDMYRYGTYYDARQEIPHWAEVGFDDGGWKTVTKAVPPKATPTRCYADPILPQYEIKPVSIEKQENFCYVYKERVSKTPCDFAFVDKGYMYDFGVNCAGVCRLKIKGERGQKIVLRHGEALVDGKFNINSTVTMRGDMLDKVRYLQRDEYILKGGEEEIFVPSFTYHGFRYAFVEGIDESQATEDLLTYIVFNSDVKRRSTFNSSNETLNTLYDMSIRADLSNIHYFPTDCPHREKNGWTGDASVSAEQFMLSFTLKDTLSFWLRQIEASQRVSGELPGIVPTSGWGFDWGNGPIWDSVCVNLPYYIYKFEGDSDVLCDNKDLIYKYLKYIATRRDERGLMACGLPDWCQPYSDNINISSPLELTDSTVVYDMASKAEFMFDVIGAEEEKAYATKLKKEMREAIRRELIDYETMTAKGSCQTSQVLLLAYGLFERDEKERAYARLLDFVEEKGYADCGLIGVRYLFHVLAENGDGDKAVELITREEEPSYGDMIRRGATALCEAFHENGVQESNNHHMYGDIINLFIATFAGININPNMCDVNEVLIAPILPESLDFAEATYDTLMGTVSVRAERIENEVRVQAYIPEGIYGKAKTCDGLVDLVMGENKFTA